MNKPRKRGAERYTGASGDAFVKWLAERDHVGNLVCEHLPGPPGPIYAEEAVTLQGQNIRLHKIRTEVEE